MGQYDLIFYFFAFVGTVLGIVALIFSTQKQKTGPRGHQGITGAIGPTGYQGFPILQTDTILISGNQLTTLGSVPIPLFKTSADAGYIFLGIMMQLVDGSPVLVYTDDLAIISGPSPAQLVATFPGTRATFAQIQSFQTLFGAAAAGGPRPGNQMYYLTTADRGDATSGGNLFTTLTFRVIYTKVPVDLTIGSGSISNQ